MLVAAFDRDRREYMNKLAEWEKKMITENRSGSSRHPANVVQPDTKARNIRMRISITRNAMDSLLSRGNLFSIDPHMKYMSNYIEHTYTT